MNPHVKDRYIFHTSLHLLPHTWGDNKTDHSCVYLLLRWGNTPLEDAVEFGKDKVVEVLKEYQQIYSHTLMPEEISTQAHSEPTDDLGNVEILERFV